MRQVAIPLVLAMLAGCTSITAERLPGQTVDGTFRNTRFSWNTGEKVAFAYKAFDYSGRVAICGAYAESPGGDGMQATANDRLIQTAYLEAHGETLVNDISFFARGQYSGKGRATGGANCILTDEPWAEAILQGKGHVQIAYAKTSFRIHN